MIAKEYWPVVLHVPKVLFGTGPFVKSGVVSEHDFDSLPIGSANGQHGQLRFSGENAR